MVHTEKPKSFFSKNIPQIELNKSRQDYDSFILHVDSEFGRLFQFLEDNKILDNTWVIFTSDHGEMHERGIWGHMTRSLHQPVVKIPLIIWEPGQQSRKDIFANTSAVDLLPTLLHEHAVPDWLECKILPPYDSSNSVQRSVFA